jgi:hypothetical protein
MFKETSLLQVVWYAVIGALMLFTIATTAERIYVISTRPPGHQCKSGETKPKTKDSFEGSCENGYWEYYPPGLP